MQRRFAVAEREIEHYALFDYVVVNDDVQRAFDELRSIVVAERARRRAAGPARRGALARRPTRRRVATGAHERRHDRRTSSASSAAAASTRSRAHRRRGGAASRRRSARRATPSSAGAWATRRCSFSRGTGAATASPPHAINFRANVCALKKLGATHLVSVSAVGSMKEDIAPGRLRRRRPVHRPHQAPRLDVLRRRRRRARRLRRSRVRATCRAALARRGRARRRAGPPRRHVRVHRGAAVLDARREPALPLVGRVGHRHDGDARGEARARGRAALRAARARDRLRLLARERGRRHASRPSSPS